MDSQGEIFRLCRLCLVKDQVDIPIFDDPGDERQILLKISSCLPVTVSQDDDLPKKICDVCSEKLDSFYEFWNSTASAEKTLRDRLAQEVRQSEPMVPKPIKTLIKEESEVLDEAHAEPVVEEESTKDETEAPPRKRPRRVSAIKAQVSIAAQESDDEEFDTAELVTKVEDGSDEMDIEEKVPNLLELPGTSTDIDQDQAGPSGLGKDEAEAPFNDGDLFLQCCGQFNEKNRGILMNVDSSSKMVSDSPKLSTPSGVLDIVVKEEPGEAELGWVSQHCQQLNIKPDIDIMPKFTFKCMKCFVEFDDRLQLEQHQQLTCYQMSPEDPSQSPVEETKLNYHKPITHGTDEFGGILEESRMKAHNCEYCGKCFSSKSSLNIHSRTHTGEKPYSCKECNTSFSRKDYLRDHVNNHTDEKPYNCNKCAMGFTRKDALICHLIVHNGGTLFTCKECGKSFSQDTSLNKHLRIHRGVKPFTCTECKKCFFLRNDLDRHSRVHTGVKPFTCNICGKHFTQKTHLVRHLKTHKPLNCDECGDTFTNQRDLNAHLKTHTKDAANEEEALCGSAGSSATPSWNYSPHNCEVCGKSFREKRNLNRHLLVHTGEKPFGCNKCGKRFSQKCSLDRHSKTHTGERPFSCQICGMSFIVKYRLRAHLTIHTGAKPFNCNECGKFFRGRSNYNKHVIRMHAGNLHSR